MNVERAIRTVVDTGEVILGAKRSIVSVMDKNAKLVIISSNCPKDQKEDLLHYADLSKVHVYEFEGSSMDLGAVCGKPYVVSMLAVVKAGDSNVFELVRRR
ncbi:MAG: 50S ribosomal protein L30e [Candidatus Hydrothermarchaeales archaeon]